MKLLIPGRHHSLTNFQFSYIDAFARSGIMGDESKVLDEVIFAVTSANHSGTRRNPLPFLHRALSIQAFATGLSIPVYIYGINDIGERDDFALFVLKTIAHESGNLHDLNPTNTIVACSTPVAEYYKGAGFTIFGAELDTNPVAPMPWELVEKVAALGLNDDYVKSNMHPSSIAIWRQYRLDLKTKTIFSDPLISSDGDLTKTRDYGTYVRQMDEIVDIKFNETRDFIKPGRIGDIGCAVGSWIKKVSELPDQRDSDFYGIELARPLFEMCRQRKENGDFANPNVFFSQHNAVRSLCFETRSMDTIHTGSLTHEIYSYGSLLELNQFIKNRFDELKPNGVWINRDVVACNNPGQMVWAELEHLGSDSEPNLAKQSTYARFLQFVSDFRPGHERIPFEIIQKKDETVRIVLKRRHLQEFLLHKDYIDNWQSEMKESFCFWTFDQWKEALNSVGFEIDTVSHTYSNPWIQKNRWEGKVRLFSSANFTDSEPWFETTMILVGRRPL